MDRADVRARTEESETWPARLLLWLAWANGIFLMLEILFNVIKNAIGGGVPIG
ncbi:MAG: hypothetical protein GWN99_00730 [Gemmatimonadetes bacterium]|uniref:Uncharacterized protein n=1 Tax=Candidatus Kutchimonas denitrificans TaxID=3056748 RepID=A0AAE4Z5X9_9BACT|nr:hypothetical protein [Gemmatimonadota bacterium]NIR73633.1 hypothetical protein [Candidatus Kutchimonas denitrificans]NIR99592.1 hypothetical protein [Gemmatimonadota bacterium]NIT65212.1 hypothetical protein [Gemmatimonadota bacterium]NIV23745.1 hypothetical protein [Gemmatimonadota bacterium]